MIKEWYSLNEAAKMLGITKQSLSRAIMRGSVKDVAEIKDSCVSRQGKKLNIPVKSILQYHKDLILWGEPYKEGDEWKIKSRTIDGEQTHKIVES